MSDHFVVEAEKRVVGLAVRVPGGFRFFTANPDFKELEAETFPRAKALARRAAQLALRLRGKSSSHSTVH